MCLVLPVFPCPLGFFLKQFPDLRLPGAASTSDLRPAGAEHPENRGKVELLRLEKPTKVIESHQ